MDKNEFSMFDDVEENSMFDALQIGKARSFSEIELSSQWVAPSLGVKLKVSAVVPAVFLETLALSLTHTSG